MATCENLTEISPATHNVALQIAYAGPDNFVGAPIYSRPVCFLNNEAAACLDRAIELAGELGFRLRVFDGYRPTEAQWRYGPTRRIRISWPTRGVGRPIRGARPST